MVDLEILFEKQMDFNRRVLDEQIFEGFYDAICDHKKNLCEDKFYEGNSVDDNRADWIFNYNRALFHEAIELEESFSWEWWKKKKDPDWENARIELVDMLHFLISQFQIVGMSAVDVFDLYMKKNKLNHHRQDKGYDENYEKVKDGVEDNKRMNEIFPEQLELDLEPKKTEIQE